MSMYLFVHLPMGVSMRAVVSVGMCVFIFTFTRNTGE